MTLFLVVFINVTLLAEAGSAIINTPLWPRNFLERQHDL